MGDDVAFLGHLVDLVGRLVARLKLMLADMRVERQIEDFREPLADLGRAIAVAAEGTHLDVAQQTGMRFLEIQPVRNRDVGDGADVGFDEVQAEDAERPDVRPGIETGFGPAA